MSKLVAKFKDGSFVAPCFKFNYIVQGIFLRGLEKFAGFVDGRDLVSVL